jgi:hypothetical protein
MKSLIVYIFCLLLAGCATTGNLKSGKGISRYQFPDQLYELDRTDLVDYEKQSPGLGYGASYRHPLLGKVDLYFYDYGNKNIPEGFRSKIIVDHFLGTIPMLVDLSESSTEGPEVEVNDASLIHLGEVTLWECRIKNLRHSGKLHDSSLLMTGFDGEIFKVRITIPNSIGSETEREAVYQAILKDIEVYLARRKQT